MGDLLGAIKISEWMLSLAERCAAYLWRGDPVRWRVLGIGNQHVAVRSEPSKKKNQTKYGTTQ